MGIIWKYNCGQCVADPGKECDDNCKPSPNPPMEIDYYENQQESYKNDINDPF